MILGSDAIVLSRQEAEDLLIAVFRTPLLRPMTSDGPLAEYSRLRALGVLETVTKLQILVRGDDCEGTS